MINLLIVLIFVSVNAYSFQVFSIGTYGVTYFDVLNFLLLLLIIKRIIWNGEKLQGYRHSSLLFYFGIFTMGIISGITPLLSGSSPMIMQFIKTLIHFLFLGSFTFICAFYPIKINVWNNMIKTYLILSLFINLFGIYQIIARANNLPLAFLPITNVSYVTHFDVNVSDINQLSLQFGNFYRATSIFSEPSSLACFNSLILIFLLIPLVQKNKPFFKSKLLNLLILILGFTGLFLSFSLTGYLTIFLILIAIILFDRTKRFLYFTGMIIITATVLTITNSVVSNYANVSIFDLLDTRIEYILNFKKGTKSGIVGESYATRVSSAKQTFDIWKDYPITGCGLGLTLYQNKPGLVYSDYSVMRVLSEMGTPGVIFFVGLFIALFMETGKFLIKTINYHYLSLENQRQLGLLFYILIYLFVTNFISGNNLIQPILWIIVGYIFSVLNSTHIDNNNKKFEIQLVKTPFKIILKERIFNYFNK